MKITSSTKEELPLARTIHGFDENNMEVLRAFMGIHRE
jgi:hypothetical protein